MREERPGLGCSEGGGCPGPKDLEEDDRRSDPTESGAPEVPGAALCPCENALVHLCEWNKYITSQVLG